jgi:hypothetical protein
MTRGQSTKHEPCERRALLALFAVLQAVGSPVDLPVELCRRASTERSLGSTRSWKSLQTIC